MSKVEKDEKKNNNNNKKKKWKGLLSACPSSGEIVYVEHLQLDRQISEPFHARKDNFSFQLKKEKKEQQQQQQQQKKTEIKKGKKRKEKRQKTRKEKKGSGFGDDKVKESVI